MNCDQLKYTYIYNHALVHIECSPANTNKESRIKRQCGCVFANNIFNTQQFNWNRRTCSANPRCQRSAKKVMLSFDCCSGVILHTLYLYCVRWHRRRWILVYRDSTIILSLYIVQLIFAFAKVSKIHLSPPSYLSLSSSSSSSSFFSSFYMLQHNFGSFIKHYAYYWICCGFVLSPSLSHIHTMQHWFSPNLPTTLPSLRRGTYIVFIVHLLIK